MHKKLLKLLFLILGTAGVWRIPAIEEAGGWKDRTTVEDMDLAVRACLKGWKFLYVGDIKVSILHLLARHEAFKFLQENIFTILDWHGGT